MALEAQIRVVGRTSLWSDYSRLLEGLPANAAFPGKMPPDQVPGELYRSDVLLQASRYEPFGLTVSEALAAGVPVVATSEVGATEGVSPEVAAVLAPGDVPGMSDAIESMITAPRGSLRATPPAWRSAQRGRAAVRRRAGLVRADRHRSWSRSSSKVWPNVTRTFKTREAPADAGEEHRERGKGAQDWGVLD